MPKSINYDGITITALHLTPNADGTWTCVADYSWTASLTADSKSRPSVVIALTGAQQTSIQTFAAAKLADLKTKDGI